MSDGEKCCKYRATRCGDKGAVECSIREASAVRWHFSKELKNREGDHVPLGKGLPGRELVLGSPFEDASCVGVTARSAKLELSGVRQVDRSRKEAQDQLK